MAASKSYFSRPQNYRFLPSDHVITTTDSIMFELDESDVWNSATRSHQSPEFRKPSSKISRKTAPTARGGVVGAASLPVNVPDWSKILKDEYRENRRSEDDDDDYEDEVDGDRIPPHEYLARNRKASLSVHEGVGRTLKGRDLSRVRNAIWQKTGFQD
ncbi:hypothetical protein BUALT_Bualt13G0075800 [Buddleja alternifolia]|uniref:Senescence regulator n=1 Tax=Buddleja alternifolia TaxID=168488 RepID=A0AAV6WLA9_9LAMI|nr:hypothetical protein BUALT_Bualt13G0075800 [Buddleja alternifolia]